MSDLESRAIDLKKNLDVISSHFQKLSWAAASEELSLHELKVVDFIGRHDSCIMREVAEYSHVAVSTMTGIIDKLEDKGLVKRERNDEDRRIVRVLLTDKGRRLYESYVHSYLEFSRRMLQYLNEDEQRNYLELTEKIAEYAAHYPISNTSI